MSFEYSFTESEIKDLEAARVVFNSFTGSRYTLQKFIKFTIAEAIQSQVLNAAQAVKIQRPTLLKATAKAGYVH